MFTGPPVFGLRTRATPLMVRGILALGMFLLFPAGSPAQHAPTPQARRRTPSVSQSPFVEAEQLFSQGQVAEAKEKTQEQLKLHPENVEGYTLLGIIYSNEKYYTSVLVALQQDILCITNY